MKLEEKLKELKFMLTNNFNVKYITLEETEQYKHIGFYKDGKILEDDELDFNELVFIAQLNTTTFLFVFNNKINKIIYTSITGENRELMDLLKKFSRSYD